IHFCMSKRRSQSFQMTPRTPRGTIIDGQRWPPGFKPDNVRSAKKMKPRPDDIFVCTFAKSGTTWIQHIVHLLLDKAVYDATIDNGDVVSSTKQGKHTTLFLESPMIEQVGAANVDGFKSPRVLKSHFNYRDMPKGGEAKYIFACRNPKDVLTSFYHHHRNFKILDFENGDFDVFFELFMKGHVAMGDYFDHLTSWLKEIDQARERILVLTYEDMVADLRSAVVQIANFIGGKAVEVISNERQLAKIVEASSFNSMKKNQQRWVPMQIMTRPLFIRKGKSRDWKNYFSHEQSERMDERFRDSLGATAAAEWWRAEMEWSEDEFAEKDVDLLQSKL
ncbi:hypothetical protein PENTCL1PPCAC_5121, partial [Pristionchus entomophagus]